MNISASPIREEFYRKHKDLLSVAGFKFMAFVDGAFHFEDLVDGKYIIIQAQWGKYNNFEIHQGDTDEWKYLNPFSAQIWDEGVLVDEFTDF